MPGASLTSTSIDPQLSSSKLVWDEVCSFVRLFIVKRRAYVRVVTSLGGSSLNLELFCEKVRLNFNSR
jgi:peptidyl-prolyl cis-trans isomerase-like protein 2